MQALAVIVYLVAWGLILGINLRLWQAGRGRGNLFMFVGAGLVVLGGLIGLVDRAADDLLRVWVPLLGHLLFVVGFALFVRSRMPDQAALVKARLSEAAAARGEDASGPSA